MAEREDELTRIRERVHKIADEIQEHRMKLAGHELRIGAMDADIADLRDSMATSEQLDNAVQVLKLELRNLNDTVSPIKRGVNAVVFLIVASVVSALLALVIMGPRGGP